MIAMTTSNSTRVNPFVGRFILIFLDLPKVNTMDSRSRRAPFLFVELLHSGCPLVVAVAKHPEWILTDNEVNSFNWLGIVLKRKTNGKLFRAVACRDLLANGKT